MLFGNIGNTIVIYQQLKSIVQTNYFFEYDCDRPRLNIARYVVVVCLPMPKITHITRKTDLIVTMVIVGFWVNDLICF